MVEEELLQEQEEQKVLLLPKLGVLVQVVLSNWA